MLVNFVRGGEGAKGGQESIQREGWGHFSLYKKMSNTGQSIVEHASNSDAFVSASFI